MIEAAPPITPGLDLSWNEVPFHAFLAGIPTVAFRLGLYGLLDDWQSDDRTANRASGIDAADLFTVLMGVFFWWRTS